MARVKYNFGKIVGLSVLVIALAAGVALTQEKQLLDQKAWNYGPRFSPRATIKPVIKPVGTPVRDLMVPPPMN